MGDDSPLFTEVYGYKSTATTEAAKAQREEKERDVPTGKRYCGECPFKGGACNKSTTTDDPHVDGTRATGVCSLNEGDSSYIVCPERFKEDGVFETVAKHMFGELDEDTWMRFDEVRIPTNSDKSAGNTDHVIALHDEDGNLIDFCGVEVQATYFSGKAYRPEFYEYMHKIDEDGDPTYVPKGSRRPDFRSCADKRLMPQVRQKGDIFNEWGKKFCVIMDKVLWDYLPEIPEADDPDFYFFVFELVDKGDHYELEPHTVHATTFDDTVHAFEMVDEKRPSKEKFEQDLREKLSDVLGD